MSGAPVSTSEARPPLPFMEWPIVAVALAAVAGILNSFTLIFAGTFATVQSGNVASSGIYLATQDGPKWVFAIVSVLAFGLGSFGAGILMASLRKRGRAYSVTVLTLLALIMAGLGAVVITGVVQEYHWIAFAVSFAAGAMGNAYHKDDNALYGAVAVTFVVQMAFNFLAQSLFNRKGMEGKPNLRWSGIFFCVLLGFAGGGMLGAWLIVLMGTDPSGFMGQDGPAHLDSSGGWVLVLAGAIMAALALLSATGMKKGRPADPTSGGYMG